MYSVKMVGAEFAIPSKILAKFETSEALVFIYPLWVCLGEHDF